MIETESGGGDGCYLNYSIFSRDACDGFFFDRLERQYRIKVGVLPVPQTRPPPPPLLFFSLFSFFSPTILLFLSLILRDTSPPKRNKCLIQGKLLYEIYKSYLISRFAHLSIPG